MPPGTLPLLPAAATPATGSGTAPFNVTGLFPTIRPSPAASATSRAPGHAAGPAADSRRHAARAGADSSLTGSRPAASGPADLLFLVIGVAALAAWLSLGRGRRPAGKRRRR
jgi:hypothetical protein